MRLTSMTTPRDQCARTCERPMREEQDMARWVWEQLPKLTRQYLERSPGGAEAKR
jgi:ferritin-like metal-binding protein YciE